MYISSALCGKILNEQTMCMYFFVLNHIIKSGCEYNLVNFKCRLSQNVQAVWRSIRKIVYNVHAFDAFILRALFSARFYFRFPIFPPFLLLLRCIPTLHSTTEHSISAEVWETAAIRTLLDIACNTRQSACIFRENHGGAVTLSLFLSLFAWRVFSMQKLKYARRDLGSLFSLHTNQHRHGRINFLSIH